MKMVTLDISEVLPLFNSFRVAVIVAENVCVNSERSDKLNRFISDITSNAFSHLSGTALSELEEVQSWRKAYKKIGVKKTSYRSSVERLLKIVKNGKELPKILNVIDAYNALSVKWHMPIGADDLDKIFLPLSFRLSRKEDTFIRLGSSEYETPFPGEIIYADSQKCLCRRWNWSQDSRSAVSISTKRIVFTVQTLNETDNSRLEEASAELSDLLENMLGASTYCKIASIEYPSVTLEIT